MDNENKTERGFGRKMTLADKIKCTFWCVAILLFTVWVASFWVLILLPFVVDVYWTHFIPWSWWRGIKNRLVREVMSWVDAIVFAIAAIWVLQNFFFQNFQIPTTSLEKTMLAGDYLLVSKCHYGPRVPMTPLSLPIFQHTIELFGKKFGKSYIEHPQVAYRRVPGLTEIKRGNIVVFNYPCGDSVIVNEPEVDYYQVRNYYVNGLKMSQQQFESAVGPVMRRPVDRRENYVKRCVGLPGETIQIVERQLYVDGQEYKNPDEMQQQYYVYTNSPLAKIPNSYWHNLGIYTHGRSGSSTVESDVYEIVDSEQTGPDLTVRAQYLNIQPDSLTGQYNHLYSVNLTAAKAAKVAQRKDVSLVVLEPTKFQYYEGIFPQSPLFRWQQNNFGPLWIPKKGEQVELNAENEALYGRCIRVYEGNTLTSDGQGNYKLNGVPATTYTFQMDYYWMMGDNRDHSLDSRFWGFVPEDHIVGTPLFIWISIDPENGDWRWDRLFKSVDE